MVVLVKLTREPVADSWRQRRLETWGTAAGRKVTATSSAKARVPSMSVGMCSGTELETDGGGLFDGSHMQSVGCGSPIALRRGNVVCCMRACRRGAIVRENSRGERGQPCSIPFRGSFCIQGKEAEFLSLMRVVDCM